MQIFGNTLGGSILGRTLLLACLLALPPVPASAGDLWLENDYLGIRFPYPAQFVVGKYRPDTATREAQAAGARSSFAQSVLLAEPGQLRQNSADAIPFGEIPVIALDIIPEQNRAYYRSLFNHGKPIFIGPHIAHRLSGSPVPYGDQTHYYLVPLADNRILEITAHRFYFRDETPAGARHKKETGYDRVIETLVEKIAPLHKP